MGAIDTEDAARRLARVILSDIDLYSRERPKPGESREAQIEEGRRLFASRVIPELVPMFARVLADRAAGGVNAPAAPAAPSVPASAAAPAVGPVHSSAAPSSAIEDEPATDPSIFVPSFEPPVRPAPAVAAPAVVDPSVEEAPVPSSTPRAPGASNPAIEDLPETAPPPAAGSFADGRSAVPTPAARPAAPALPPPSVVARARPESPIRVPPAPPPTGAPAAVAQARPAAPPGPEIPASVPSAPVPTAHLSLPRLLAIVSAVAAIVAMFHRFFR